MNKKYIGRWALVAGVSALYVPAWSFPATLAKIGCQALLAKQAGQSTPDQNSAPAGAASASAQSAPAWNGRALPSPLSSPPFPFTDWSVNGGNPIGASWDASKGSLQNALFGSRLDKSRIHVYGWIDGGYNASTSDHSNLPYIYSIQPNHLILNQAVLRAERTPDTTQTAHSDWGFRVTALYGEDYRTGLADGYFYNQLQKRNALYGFDAPEMFGEYYLPKLAQGTVIQVGRYFAPPNCEGELAPYNYLYSHALGANSDPYTYTGANAQIRLSPYWTVFAGVHAGDDKSPFEKSAALNGELMVGWQDHGNRDSVWGGFDSLGGGKYKAGHDDVQIFSMLWGHKFNELWHMQTQFYYMWQYDAEVGGSEIDGPNEPYAPGGAGAIIPGQSHTLAALNYLSRKLGPNDSLTLRTELFDDAQGQRTGFPNVYTTYTLGLTHYFTPALLFRPEIRFDNADRHAAYDNGTRKTQWTLAADIVFKF